jgi:peroxiredoxin Q/BCP
MLGSVRAAAAIFVALAVAGCNGPVKRPDGGVGLMPIGEHAPDIEGLDGSGKEVKLSDLRGSLAVVYFYPADGSSGCTKEACAFRDVWKKYDEAKVTIFGVSTDTSEAHKKFAHDQKLPFPLVADPTGTIGTAYGVRKTMIGYDRVSFLVDRDGRIARIWSEVDPGVHAEEVLAEAKRVH